MNINSEIDDIRNKVYGKDVKNAIVTALEKVYSNTETNVEMEVAGARGDYSTLGERLEQQEIDENNLLEKIMALSANTLIVADTIPETLEDGQICIVYEDEE